MKLNLLKFKKIKKNKFKAQRLLSVSCAMGHLLSTKFCGKIAKMTSAGAQVLPCALRKIL